MSTLKPTRVNIKRKRGDTSAIVFVVKDPETRAVVDISIWSGFLLTVDPSKEPTDALANVFQSTGALLTDGTDGKIRFFPPGTSAIGNFYYDAQATDNDTKITTIAEGSYIIKQDITK